MGKLFVFDVTDNECQSGICPGVFRIDQYHACSMQEEKKLRGGFCEDFVCPSPTHNVLILFQNSLKKRIMIYNENFQTTCVTDGALSVSLVLTNYLLFLTII